MKVDDSTIDIDMEDDNNLENARALEIESPVVSSTDNTTESKSLDSTAESSQTSTVQIKDASGR